MTQTNLILKMIRFNHIKPQITIELVMDNYGDALNISDKLNDVAKAKDESTTSYFVQTIDIPSLTKEVYDDDTVDLIIEVEEKQTGTFNAGISLGTLDGFAIVTGLRENNFYGTGRSLDLSLIHI